jgi:homoserine kinase
MSRGAGAGSPSSRNTIGNTAGSTPRGTAGNPSSRPPSGERAPAPRWAQAWAPASVGNVSVGFDLLGHSLGGAGDEVRVERIEAGTLGERVTVEAIEGLPLELPRRAESNTAGAALLAMIEALGLGGSFRVRIHKGIPLGSGMGGSAASAVAAVVAANELLDEPLPREALYPFALAGEQVASGSVHGDNVGPQLIGGLVLALPDRLVPVPVPDGLHCALVHPHFELETRRAREVLRDPFALSAVVAQTCALSRLLAACYTNDLELLRGELVDVLVEPRRAPLIPGFAPARAAALAAGALGAGISGGGPSIFAWCVGPERARAAAEAVRAAFAEHGLASDILIGPVDGPRARITARG